VDNFALVHPDTIEKHWGSAPEEQMAFVRVAPGQDAYGLSAAITDLDTVLNVSVSRDLADMISSMMDGLDLVIVLIVVSAGLLAVTVLYNLTNINIKERIREIATIKVLGFHASETGAYVFKENMILTVFGSLLGLGLGWLLLLFVIQQVKVDMVWFKATIEPISYVLSVALTIVSSLVVDFIFYFKLDKINMAEALKSVE
jgi:putative ABC transport system permease protein